MSQEPTSIEQADGMLIEWDVPIRMDDGVVLRADVFRPPSRDRFPALLTYGPYGKGLAFQDGYAPQWQYMVEEHPDVLAGSTNKYQNWEVPDPEKWVPDGYAIVRVDSRGAGRSPGVMDLWSPRESRDFYQCIEWAASQPWCNGKVGLTGISYYAMNQYQVASLAPPSLAAICPWEGASDWYREFARHGGILSTFSEDWYPRQVATVQHGTGSRGFRSRIHGEWVAGPDTVPEGQLEQQRRDLPQEASSPELESEWHLERSPDWGKVTVPMLSAANWGGQGLHSRGNFEAFVRAASDRKWLEVHGGAHWAWYYTDYATELQKRFFGHFLKGEANGWDCEAPVLLHVRNVDGSFTKRHEAAWPIPDTRWTSLYLDCDNRSLVADPPPGPSHLTYSPLSSEISFSIPITATTEITGPIAATLHVASESVDADLFLTLRLFDEADHEVTFMGALDPNTPLAQGWLRASHRELDMDRTLPHRPFHRHRQKLPLTPGQIYELNIEIWPTSIIIPSGFRLVLTVGGRDYRFEGELSDFARSFHYAGRGVGPFQHASPSDRPDGIFRADVTVYSGGEFDSRLMVPIIPPR